MTGRRLREPEESFLDKISLQPSGCVSWDAYRMVNGYGTFWNGVRKVLAHRFAYELVHGVIPEGLTIDHLCRNRGCVNPWHLEAVPQKVNSARGNSWAALSNRLGHCRAGHPWSPENTRVIKGYRHCRACDARRQREYRERRDAQ